MILKYSYKLVFQYLSCCLEQKLNQVAFRTDSRYSFYPSSEPGFSFRLSFSFHFFSAFSHKSPSGLYSACVTNACLRHITEVVVVKASSSESMISRAMKSHTNEHTVRGRPTLKVVNRFRKGSVGCKTYERSTIYERTF